VDHSAAAAHDNTCIDHEVLHHMSCVPLSR